MRTNNVVAILLGTDKCILDAENRAGLKVNEEGYLKYILEHLMSILICNIRVYAKQVDYSCNF